MHAMVAKRQKSLHLSDDVLAELEQEDNQSATVEKLLREHYEL